MENKKLAILITSVALFGATVRASQTNQAPTKFFCQISDSHPVSSAYGFNLTNAQLKIDAAAKTFHVDASYQSNAGRTFQSSIDGILRILDQRTNDNGFIFSFELLKENIRSTNPLEGSSTSPSASSDTFPQTLGELTVMSKADGTSYSMFSEYDHFFLLLQHTIGFDDEFTTICQ